MIRLLGFLTGSAATTAVILAVIGLPERVPSDAVEAPGAAAAASEPRESAPLPVPKERDEPEPSRIPIAEQQSHPGPGPGPDPAVADAAPHWHSFWNPFRSEIAANGFAARLRAVTGIDYRVVRLEPGSYQVAFAYSDDGERRSKISQIENATGLNLPEDSP